MTPTPDAKVDIYGSLAFVPQKPEILSGTMKSNILFGLLEDTQKLE